MMYDTPHLHQCIRMLARFGLMMIFTAISCLHLHAQVNASFTINQSAGCSPLWVEFSNTSTGNPDSCRWDFGNGNVSINCSAFVFASYTEPGNYTATLRVYKDGVFSSASKSITVFKDPVADFNTDKTEGCIPFTTTFNENIQLGEAPIASRLWTFGDGRKSSLPNASHTYNSKGSFSVGLLVIDENGCQDDTVQQMLINTETFPVASFVIDKNVACQFPFQASFTDLSQSAQPLTYAWNFGDGGTSTTNNPVHTYSGAGTFNVSLQVKNEFGCTDDTLVVNTISIENFTTDIQVNDTAGCAPFNLTFGATSSAPAEKYTWTLADGTVLSEKASDSYLLSNPGNYVIRLEAVSANGCVATKRVNIRVKKTPVADFSATPTESCVTPLQVQFANASLDAVQYLWNFGNGNTSSQVNPIGIYAQTGEYSVSLRATSVEGCSATKRIDGYINISDPEVEIVADAVGGCSPFTTGFQIAKNGPGTILKVEWIFGNGNTFTGLNPPPQTYPNPGNYAVTATVTFETGCPVQIINKTITAGTAPTGISASVNPDNACVNANLTFRATGGGNDVVFSWDLGNGETRAGRSFTYAYPESGDYSVVLTANQSGCPVTIPVNVVKINPPSAEFRVSGVCSGLRLRFQNLSTTYTDAVWNFGDGSPLVSDNGTFVFHTFPANGIYNVQLIVSNNTSGCADTIANSVDLRSFRPDINIPKRTGCVPLTVGFSDTNSFVKSIQWDLGDTIITRKTFDYTFNKPGRYTIKVYTVDQVNCRDTSIFNDIIEAIQLNAGFSFNPPGGCAPITISFNDTTPSPFSTIQQWQWNFGGLGSSSIRSPSFTFNANDTLTVRLIVTDNIGCQGTVSKRIFITNPEADFTANFNSICTGTAFPLTNQSSGVGLSYLWDFGNGSTSTDVDPGVIYNQTGSYPIQLTVTDANNCRDSILKNNFVRVENFNYDFSADLTSKPCPPLLSQFKIEPSDITYRLALWDFGDGNKSDDSLRFPVNLFADAGSYNVQLVLEDYRGCRDTIFKPNYIKVSGPSGSYTADPVSGCVPLEVTFNASFESAVSLFWDLGDGTGIVDTLLNPSFKYTYNSPSAASTTLFLIDKDNCLVTKKGPTIFPSLPKSIFSFSTDTACNGEDIAFIDLSTSQEYAPLTSRLWNWGDGSTSEDLITSHSYSVDSTQTFIVQLTVDNSFGCTNTDSAYITVFRTPPLETDGNKKICKGDQVQLNASGVVHYNWSPANTLSDPNIANPIARPSSQTVYIVTGSEIDRCPVNDTVIVFVTERVEATAGPDTTICIGQPLQLNIVSDNITSGSYTYRWEPAALFTDPNISNPTVQPTEDVVYTVTVSNGQCRDAILPVYVQVNALPEFTTEELVKMFRGSSIQLEATSSEPVTYSWTPENYLSCSSCPNPVASPPETIVYTVTATGLNGCSSTKQVRIELLSKCGLDALDMPNVFSPNNDGYHDLFKVRGEGIREVVSFNVFSRNGEKVFESNSLNVGWDGTYNGVELNTGVYIYYAEIICTDGKKATIKGNVTLLR